MSQIAIIDIGSNSMRLVVYDGVKRAAVPLYNEKVMCQLGLRLASSGVLHPEGVELARATMRRYMALTRAMGVTRVHTMATAAVRDASDGAAFARELEKEHSIKIDIISGEREAKLGAYGVCSSVHQPSGLTGDLGGGSMELVRLDRCEFREQATLPIGPLRLLDITKGDPVSLRKAIARAFAPVEWIADARPEAFYAIGGTFRAIAHVHMALTDYPLHILHEYTVDAGEMLSFARELVEMPPEKLKKLPSLPGKRVHAIPAASAVLAHVLETAKPAACVFSASGVREGYLYEMLSPKARAQDALLEAVMELAQHGGRGPAYAQELMAWMQPLFVDESETDRRLREAFCLLAEIGHHLHPEYRASAACGRVLHSSFTALTHAERVQLSLALYHRYQAKLKHDHPAFRLADAREHAWARKTGALANLAYHLSGGQPGILSQTVWTIDKKSIGLTLPPSLAALDGETIRKRVAQVREEWAS